MILKKSFSMRVTGKFQGYEFQSGIEIDLSNPNDIATLKSLNLIPDNQQDDQQITGRVLEEIENGLGDLVVSNVRSDIQVLKQQNQRFAVVAAAAADEVRNYQLILNRLKETDPEKYNQLIELTT